MTSNKVAYSITAIVLTLFLSCSITYFSITPIYAQYAPVPIGPVSCYDPKTGQQIPCNNPQPAPTPSPPPPPTPQPTPPIPQPVVPTPSVDPNQQCIDELGQDAYYDSYHQKCEKQSSKQQNLQCKKNFNQNSEFDSAHGNCIGSDNTLQAMEQNCQKLGSNYHYSQPKDRCIDINNSKTKTATVVVSGVIQTTPTDDITQQCKDQWGPSYYFDSSQNRCLPSSGTPTDDDLTQQCRNQFSEDFHYDHSRNACEPSDGSWVHYDNYLSSQQCENRFWDGVYYDITTNACLPLSGSWQPYSGQPPTIDFGPHAKKGAFSDYSRRVLEKILEASGVDKVVITSTIRTPEDQARIMYENLDMLTNKKGFDEGVAASRPQYGTDPLSPGNQAIDVYVNSMTSGENKDQVITDMISKIRNLSDQGKWHSHLSDPKKLGVFDIDPASIPDDEKKSFVDTVNKAKGTIVSKFLQPPDDLAYHIEIQQK